MYSLYSVVFVVPPGEPVVAHELDREPRAQALESTHVVGFPVRVEEEGDLPPRQRGANILQDALGILVGDVAIIEKDGAVRHFDQGHVALAHVDEVDDDHPFLPA